MHRRPWRSGGITLVTVVILVSAACGQSVVTPSPATSATATAAPSTTAPPSTPPTPVPPSDPPAGAARWALVEAQTPGPGAREGHTWTVDPSGAVAYLFGGRDSSGDLNDLWSYDLTADAWQRLEPAGERPAARSGHVAAWIDGLGLVVIGGRTGATASDELWAYDPNADAWRRLETASGLPSPRAGACTALRADGRLWVSHGRAADGGSLADTWIFDPGPSTWTEVTPDVPGPNGRDGSVCWWTDDDRFVLLGGRSGTDEVVGDMWVLHTAGSGGANWTEDPSGNPPRSTPGATRSSAAVILFGGVGAGGLLLDDLVAYDPRTLASTTIPAADVAPSPRTGATLVDDPEGERLILFGGRDASGPSDELWSLNLP